MQIVGQTCNTCGGRITTISEGNGCPACCLVWHRDCNPGPEFCPSCKQDVREAHRAIFLAREDSFQDQIRQGRIIYWIMLGMETLARLPGIIILFSQGEMSYGFFAFVSFAGYFAAWLAAFLGSSRARHYLGAAAFLNLLLSMALFRISPVGFALAILADIFSIWVCFFSNDAKMFEGRIRAKRPELPHS